MNKWASKKEGAHDLEGPHYEDQWWMGGKSYVSLSYLFQVVSMKFLYAKH
jgi:hypothetical protein